MPAQISHLVFGEEALRAALGADAEAILDRFGNVFRFGTQGPDFFYHNQRTRPSGLKYGVALHREGYGRLIACLVREHLRLRSPAVSTLGAYILGFATHAILDRKTHPYINYFSGWVERGDPASQRYYRCHVYLERVLDVLVLRERRRQDLRELRILEQLYCGETLPYLIVKALLKALHTSYPRMRYKSQDRRRIDNAYLDTLFFYVVTDPLSPHFRRLAYLRDQEAGKNRKRLALFHPLQIDEEIDFLNRQHAEWSHPCDRSLRSRDDFFTLYQEALEQAADLLSLLRDALCARKTPDDVEAALGNESLETGFSAGTSAAQRFCSPLPLSPLIDALYREFDSELLAQRQ
jgi:hypothetical protein